MHRTVAIFLGGAAAANANAHANRRHAVHPDARHGARTAMALASSEDLVEIPLTDMHNGAPQNAGSWIYTNEFISTELGDDGECVEGNLVESVVWSTSMWGPAGTCIAMSADAGVVYGCNASMITQTIYESANCDVSICTLTHVLPTACPGACAACPPLPLVLPPFSASPPLRLPLPLPLTSSILAPPPPGRSILQRRRVCANRLRFGVRAHHWYAIRIHG